MKKLIAFTALALAVTTAPALADNHGEGGKHKGGMFEKHDTNSDGVISKSEFLSHAEERFEKMDADGNGEVSKEEGKAAHEAMREKMKDRREKRQERKENKADE